MGRTSSWISGWKARTGPDNPAIRASAESDQASAAEAVPTFGGTNLAGADSAAADPGRDAEDDGVDVSLVRWLLSLSVAERLAVLQAQASSLAKMRDAVAER